MPFCKKKGQESCLGQPEYPTRNDRLLRYEKYGWYCDVCLTHWGLGHSLVALALWDQWKEDAGGEGVPNTYTKLALREFRCHPNARGRFMVPDLDSEDPARTWSTVGAEQWTDYHAATPYGDFELTLDDQNNPVIGEQIRYPEGFGLHTQAEVCGSRAEEECKQARADG